jgi:hypothetical protein
MMLMVLLTRSRTSAIDLCLVHIYSLRNDVAQTCKTMALLSRNRTKLGSNRTTLGMFDSSLSQIPF